MAAAFDEVGLDWRQHVRFDESFARGAADSPELVGDPAKARDRLGWQAETGFDELVRMMVVADLELLKDQAEPVTSRAASTTLGTSVNKLIPTLR